MGFNNNLNEPVGSVDVIIISFDTSVSYAIVNAGGFLAVTKTTSPCRCLSFSSSTAS